MLRKLTLAGCAAALLFGSVHVYAGLTGNSLTMNGTQVNGGQFNGVGANGLGSNGIMPNGARMHGPKENDSGFEGLSAPRIIGVDWPTMDR